MARETKVGLLIGIGVILLIGIIISDHLSVVQKSNPSAALTQFGNSVQDSIYPPASPTAPTVPAVDTSAGLAPLQAGTSKQDVARAPTTIQPASAVHPVLTPAELAARDGMGRGNRSVSQADQANRQNHEILPPRAFALGGPVPVTHQPAQPVIRQANAALNNPPAPSSTTTRSQASNRTQSGDILYTVKPGQSLYAIAQLQYGNGGYWKSIAQANPNKVGPHGQVNAGTQLLIPNRAGFVKTTTSASRAVPGPGSPKTITVHPGDTLAALAQQYLGHASRWRALMKANADKIDKPQDLRAGMTLVLPAATAQSAPTPSTPATPSNAAHRQTYTVRPGDTLASIAQRTLGSKSAWHKIFQANRNTLNSPDQLRVGQTLVIP